MKALRRVVTALLCIVVVLGAAAAPASAHAQLVSTNPADGAHVEPAPKQVCLRFSEHVSLKLGGVRVLNTNGERVDKDDAKAVNDTVTVGLRDGLGDGPYVVAWNVISADSHPVNGAFTFVVGAGAAATDQQVASLLALPSDKAWRVAAGVGRFLSYAGLLLAAGGIVFLTVVDRRRPSKAVAKLIVGAAAIGRLRAARADPPAGGDRDRDGVARAAVSESMDRRALEHRLPMEHHPRDRRRGVRRRDRVGRLACVGRASPVPRSRSCRSRSPAIPEVTNPEWLRDPRGHRARGRGGGLVRRRRAADPDVEAAKRRR